MRVLVLGHGKTGKLVSEVAHERGHSVHVLDAKENPGAAALTHPFVAGFDVVIDFTTPEAAVQNMRACLATGARHGGRHDGLVCEARGHAWAGRATGGGSAVRNQFLRGGAGDAAAGGADGERRSRARATTSPWRRRTTRASWTARAARR